MHQCRGKRLSGHLHGVVNRPNDWEDDIEGSAQISPVGGHPVNTHHKAAPKLSDNPGKPPQLAVPNSIIMIDLPAAKTVDVPAMYGWTRVRAELWVR
jgi:hypothetical protein